MRNQRRKKKLRMVGKKEQDKKRIGINRKEEARRIEERWRELGKTSLTEFRHQMRSGDLLAYVYLNCVCNGIISCS